MLFYSEAMARIAATYRALGPFEPTCISAPYSGDTAPPARGSRSPDEVDAEGYASAALAVKLTGLDERRMRRQSHLGRIAWKTVRGRIMYLLTDVEKEKQRKLDTYGRNGSSPWRKTKKPNNPKPIIPKTCSNAKKPPASHPWLQSLTPKGPKNSQQGG